VKGVLLLPRDVFTEINEICTCHSPCEASLFVQVSVVASLCFQVVLPFSPVEDVVDLAADVCTKAKELAIYPVQNGLEEVSFSGILTVEQLQQL